jgi:uncharacterized membrane protein
MTKTVVGSFDSYREAQDVVQDLQSAGFGQSDINIVASNLRGEYRTPEPVGTATGTTYGTNAPLDTGRTFGNAGLGATDEGYTAGDTVRATSATGGSMVGTSGTIEGPAADRAAADEAHSGAATGAVTGGIIGGVAGLALAFTSLTIPVVGPIIAAGPIVSTLTGVGVGAVAGGLIGGLTDLGVTPEHAEYYAESVRRGGAMVTVRADDARADEVTRIMQRHGAIDINKRAETWRSAGWQGFDQTAKPYTVDDLERERGLYTQTTTPRTSYDWSMYRDEFRSDFDRDYAGMGYRFEDYEPSYRWGYENARKYPGDWTAAEASMRSDWERANPGSDWERFKDAVRRGWDRFTSGVSHAVGSDDTRAGSRL